MQQTCRNLFRIFGSSYESALNFPSYSTYIQFPETNPFNLNPRFATCTQQCAPRSGSSHGCRRSARRRRPGCGRGWNRKDEAETANPTARSMAAIDGRRMAGGGRQGWSSLAHRNTWSLAVEMAGVAVEGLHGVEAEVVRAMDGAVGVTNVGARTETRRRRRGHERSARAMWRRGAQWRRGWM